MFVRNTRVNSPVLLAIAVLCFDLAISGAQAQTKPAPAKEQAPKNAVDEKALRGLVKQLGDEDYVKREAAQKQLAKIGEPALGLLKKAAKDSTDAEVRERATELIQRIQESGLHQHADQGGVGVRPLDSARRRRGLPVQPHDNK